MRPFLFTLMLSALVAAITGCGGGNDPLLVIYPQASQMVGSNTLIVSKGERAVMTARISDFDEHSRLRAINEDEVLWSTNLPGMLKLDPLGTSCVVTALHDRFDSPNDVPPTITLTVEYHGVKEIIRTYVVTNLAGLWQFSFDGKPPVDLNLDQDGSLIAIRNSQPENRGQVTLASTAELVFEGRQLVGRIVSPLEIVGTYNAKGDNSSSWSAGYWTATKLTPRSN